MKPLRTTLDILANLVAGDSEKDFLSEAEGLAQAVADDKYIVVELRPLDLRDVLCVPASIRCRRGSSWPGVFASVDGRPVFVPENVDGKPVPVDVAEDVFAWNTAHIGKRFEVL